jgi:hypothetical protein
MLDFGRTTVNYEDGTRRIEAVNCNRCGWRAFGTRAAVRVAEQAHICAAQRKPPGCVYPNRRVPGVREVLNNG